MIFKFNIINQEIDLSNIMADEQRRKWYFKNSLPKIPEETKIEDLTDKQKISLIKLSIYEGALDQEELCNLPHQSFKILKNEQDV